MNFFFNNPRAYTAKWKVLLWGKEKNENKKRPYETILSKIITVFTGKKRKASHEFFFLEFLDITIKKIFNDFFGYFKILTDTEISARLDVCQNFKVSKKIFFCWKSFWYHLNSLQIPPFRKMWGKTRGGYL